MSTDLQTTQPDFAPSAAPAQSSSGAALVARAAQEVQAALISAKRFPRDQKASFDRIIQACDRVSLAEQARYSFRRGGQEVSGPSIRLAETLAQAWGNLQFGFHELDQANGVSEVEAFCWDLETNVRRALTFKVPHVRETKQGGYTLTGARDVYELVANQASRRVRNCILAVIPGDVVEAAEARCEQTLAQKGTIEEKRGKIVAAFGELGVTRDDIERRLGKSLDAMSHTDYVGLRKIYASIRDGASDKDDWFTSAADPKKIVREQEAAAAEGAPPMEHEKRDAAAELQTCQRAFEDAVAAARKAGHDANEVLKGRFVEVNTSMSPTKLRAATALLQAAAKRPKGNA